MQSIFSQLFVSKVNTVSCFQWTLMSQSIPTGYIPPPGNPRENFFERANPGHPGKIFCLIPCPGAKMMVEFPGVGQNFPKLEETAP